MSNMINLGETDCGFCKHWTAFTDQDWEEFCKRHYDRFGWDRPDHKYNFGWCDKIPEGTVYCEEGYRYDGYSFFDENYDFDLHCFEARESV